ncbi:resistance to inhibitors of cholinesterase protein 3 isoform X3 [Eurosta solidaginis]|uniref:resistance to inhibitors of cholinesterase protein 3 isoform X3 n=1 Tax=Eurosta solidaginis TaxID=178769 RepID=UPI0035308196
MHQTRAQPRTSNHPTQTEEGLSPKKTAVIIVTVVGCIAILWPKVFYPMMFGGVAPSKNANLNDQRGPGALRQERPAHLHPESIYQAMRERGRAIPATTPTVPILERKGSPSNSPPRIVDGRPGPIPGMRPPMGGGSMHQPQARAGNGMGFIMPLYTIGIIVFFGYTIMKIVFKRPVPNAPYGPTQTDPNFRKQVFGQENGRHVEELNGSKLGWQEHQARPRKLESITGGSAGVGSELYNASLATASAASNLSTQLKQHSHGVPITTLGGYNKETDQLMEIEKLRKKLEDTEKAMAKLIAEMNSDQYEAKKSSENSTSNSGDISNGHTKSEHGQKNGTIESNEYQSSVDKEKQQGQHPNTSKPIDGADEKSIQQRKQRDGSVDRSVAVLGMEVTASCEGGQKWTGRSPTPVLFSHHEHSNDEEQMPEPQSIYLEGALSHESKILVADSEVKTEEVYDQELNGSPEEPAVVLSSKMTLSLINLDVNHEESDEQRKPEVESPLADDIEIIGDDEKYMKAN